MQLEVRTGDVTSETKQLRSLAIQIFRDRAAIQFTLDDATGEIQFTDWPLLLEQVQDQELVKRHTPDLLEPPLRLLVNVTSRINSTPVFQLFLAGIDIAERMGLVGNSSFDLIRRRFTVLRHSMPSVTGAGGLFFVPDDLLNGHDPAVSELVKNNKLCSATIIDAETIRRFYIPYATPIGFVAGPVSNEAERLWDAVRNLYYAFRQSQ